MAFSLTSTGVRLDGTTLRAKCKTDNGKLVDSALDLNMSISNNNGSFYLPGRMFGASASDIRLEISMVPSPLWNRELSMHPLEYANRLADPNGHPRSQRITQSCSATFLEGSILKGLCLGSDGKLHPSTIDLNGCHSNDNGRFVAGSKVFDTARIMDLVPSGEKIMLRGQLFSRNEELHHLSLFVVNIDGKFSFAKRAGRFEQDGPVKLSFDITSFTRSVLNGLPLLAGNDVWAKRVATFCSNSPIICVTLFLGAFLGGPLGGVVSAGIITPIGLVVDSAITGVIKDPVLKGEYEEAVVGRFLGETIFHMLVDGGAELLAEAVGTLAGLDVETAVAEFRGVFHGAKVEVAELGSYRLLEKFVGAVFKKETPKDWLETLEKVGKLGQA